jgi:ATP-binding cassette subfamily B (MDR/TAP) protein 1
LTCNLTNHTIGSVFALGGGSVTQIFSLFFGRLFNSFYEDVAAIEAAAKYYIIIWLALGIGGMVFRYLAIFLWTRVVERILRVLKLKFYRSLIYQDVGYYRKRVIIAKRSIKAAFYETNASGALLTKMASNFSTLQVGLEVPPTFLGSLSSVLVGLVVSFIQGWNMTLVSSLKDKPEKI